MSQGKRVKELTLQGLLETQVVLPDLQEGEFSGLVIALQLVQVLLDAAYHFPAELSFLPAIMQLLEVFVQCSSELIDFF